MGPKEFYAKSYRFRLDNSSKKFRCPNCDKKRFVRYMDQKTGHYLPKQYGRCDREVKCGYFLNPYHDGFANEKLNNECRSRYQSSKPPADYIPIGVFLASLQEYSKNKFASYLSNLFGEKLARLLIEKYYIGSSKYWPGSTVFWQIDTKGNIHTGKVMLYDNSGHRVKKPRNHIHWAHSLLFDDFNLDQCLFGEHLLFGDKNKPVAIVESEKTAAISSVYFPEFIWLATGALHNLKPERCRSLMGRRVVLFPDLGAYDDWQQKATDLSYFCDISVSDMLEKHANTRAKQEGYDLADYLITHDLSKFRNVDNSSF